MVDESQPLSVRIVKVDYYLVKPVAVLDDPCYSGFRSLPIHQVPVLRIFGSTAEGVKCCVHVHGVFPYIYVPNWNHELREKDFYAFASSLDKAINTSFACSSSKTCHVHRISSISGRPYYGYYEDEKEFLKIEFYNPALVKRASDLLLNAAVFNTNFQPHEAHVPYILQFFIDNNLYGMSFMTLSSFRTRTLTATDVRRQTNMTLEVDSSVKYILRESTSGEGMPNNPGLAFIWEEERKRKLQKGEYSITPNVSQVRPERKSSRTESYYMNKLLEKLKRSAIQNTVSKESTVSVEEDVTTPNEELNSQAQDILVMLEKLAPTNEEVSSQCSSPSIVFSDDEERPQEQQLLANIALIRSQPLLKQSAENDSILGDNFSDEDDVIDEDDHLMLSQSVYQPQHGESSDDELDGVLDNIPQLDGADGVDVLPTRSKKPAKPRRYNLRSAKEEVQKSKDKRRTPLKQYPQLDIATQVSPRSSVHTPTKSPSATGSVNSGPALESYLTSFALDSYRSPTTSSPSEGRRSESKRVYPQLDLNFQKSPRSQVKVDPESDVKRRKLSGGMKKRKIDFDELDTKENSGISMTTRWKRLQRSKKEQTPSSAQNDQKEADVDGALSCDVEDLHAIARNATYVISERGKDETNHNANDVFTVSNEIGSQKYSLKIRFDACGSADRKVILENLLSKEPVVVLQRMNCSGASEKEVECIDCCSQQVNEEQENSALVLSTKSDSCAGDGGSSQASSNETKKSLEVNFWDMDYVSSPPKNVPIDELFKSSSESTNALSETIIPSSNSRSSPEFGSMDSVPSQNPESDNNYPTPDFVDEEELFPDESQFSCVGDDRFSPPRPSLKVDKATIEEVLPVRSVFETLPNVIDDEHLASTRGPTFDFETLSSQERALRDTINDAKSIAALYSSINDDEFPEPEARNWSADCEKDDSDPVMFSQDSEDDRAFAEFSFSQVKSNEVTSKPADGRRFVLDNSIWDTTENTSNEDDRIRSFYGDDSVNVVNATQFRGKEDEAPVVEILTPEGGEREILSWNLEQSVFNEKHSSNDELSDVDGGAGSCNASPRRLSEETLSDESSPPAPKECVPHSTPQITGKKKSPSPTYTPILKKLMLKRINDQTRGAKSRLSSQRFQTEPFLAGIQEEGEEELKDDKVIVEESISMDATAGTSAEKTTPEQRSRSSVGSERIDVTMANTYGFRMSLENLQNVKTETRHQFVTVMSVELFATTRNDLHPDPEIDPVYCIFYSVFHDDSDSSKLTSGIIIVSDDEYQLDFTRFNCEKQFVKDEQELLTSFVALVEHWDPDIFVGYEIEMLSWGYLIQRAQHLGLNYVVDLSRVKEEKKESFKEKTMIEDSEYTDDLKLVGRIVLNVWRLMRHEIALQSYTFENILFHILHQRVPKHSFRILTDWWKTSLQRWIVIDYYLLRVESNILLLQQLDFFGRTSELARLFGIQFYEVLSRGSQFRVESMMLRLAKKQNFIAVSPSVKQRAKMRAPESLPLIMEPESKYYTDPVIVLDFQSLYPSIIIAYNYCFSTCLGRVEHLAERETFSFGCVQHTVPFDLISKLQSSLNISPCGVAFVKQHIRSGILPEMLEEILNTRLMVKKSMKENKDDKTLQRVLHARQLGLKLIANVTYGYTSANFSGRMPCIEIGDSVVSKGRETLERAIEMVSKNKKWAAKVIYGDTDSIFVMVPKRSKEEAFRIGAEIVEAVTNDNPKPVKLKLEKVYYPCILQTKKRYVGYMYESCDQKEPVYDAKGIETVRRDGCPAVAKILEKSLRLLFDQNDVNCVKQYVQRQFAKLVAGRLSVQELTFAREYRGMNNYKPAACVPALQLARQAILRDRRSEPRIKERVRYVLTVGPPGVPLIRSVRTPEEFLDTPGAIINAEYYITRAIIPALERCFSLLGVDVRVWYAELPRKRKHYLPVANDLNKKTYTKNTISHYFATSKCIACEESAVTKVCKECQKNPQKLALTLGTMINKLQRRYNYLEKICRSCSSRTNIVGCSSLDCSSYYNYRLAIKDVEQIPYLEELQQTFLRRSNV